jgi:hypothetical protein
MTILVVSDGSTYDPQATPQVHPGVTRAVPPHVGRRCVDVPDDTAYILVRIPQRHIGMAGGVAGRRGGRDFVLFEDLVQRDVERSARLDRAPRAQTRKVIAEHRPAATGTQTDNGSPPLQLGPNAPPPGASAHAMAEHTAAPSIDQRAAHTSAASISGSEVAGPFDCFYL